MLTPGRTATGADITLTDSGTIATHREKIYTENTLEPVFFYNELFTGVAFVTINWIRPPLEVELSYNTTGFTTDPVVATLSSNRTALTITNTDFSPCQ
jgi:hypothetical protein